MHNWYEIQQQVEAYAGRMVELFDRRRETLKAYLTVFICELSENWKKWKEIAFNNTHHLVPDFDEAPNTVYPVRENPPPAVMLSSDGSQVFPSRHEIAPLALITISRIRIDYHRYQDTPLLDCRATVFLQEDFNEIVGQDREISFEDLVSDRRTLEELNALAELAEEQSRKDRNESVIALSDGSLILWRLAERFEYDYEKRIVDRYIETLKRFQQCQVATAGYISSSNSREVVNLVQLVLQTSQINRSPIIGSEPFLTDTELFSRILKKGTRSTLFHSQSRIVKEKYTEQKISYFYLHGGNEIAKVEIPHWIAIDKARVDEIAAYCFQQAQIGGGYPVVLSEAHERAVVRGPDRETFFALVEESLRKKGYDPSFSAKQLRKRMPLT